MIGIGTDSARRIARVVKRDEQRPYNETGGGRGIEKGIEVHPVKITSTTQTAGRYPGTLYQRNGNADTFTQLSTAAGDIWVDTPNGEGLTTDTYYYARITGVRTADNKIIFETIGNTGAFSGARLYFASSFVTGNGPILTWLTEFDTGGYAGPGNGFVIPATGKYLLTACLGFVNNGTQSGETMSIGLSAAGAASGPMLAGATAPRGDFDSINGAVCLSAIENIQGGLSRGIFIKESSGNPFEVSGNDVSGVAFAVMSHFAITRL